MAVTPTEMDTSFSAVQSEKAQLPIALILPGMEMLVILSFFWNAAGSSLVTVSGIAT